MASNKVVKKGLGRAPEPKLVGSYKKPPAPAAPAPVPAEAAPAVTDKVEQEVVAQVRSALSEVRAPDIALSWPAPAESRDAPDPAPTPPVEAPKPPPQVIDKPHAHVVRTTPRPDPGATPALGTGVVLELDRPRVEPKEPGRKASPQARSNLGTAETLPASGSMPGSGNYEYLRGKALEAKVVDLTAIVEKRDLRISELEMLISELKRDLVGTTKSHDIAAASVERYEKELKRLRAENDTFRRSLNGHAEAALQAKQELEEEKKRSSSNPPVLPTAAAPTEKKGGGRMAFLLVVLAMLAALGAVLYFTGYNPFDSSTGGSSASDSRTGTTPRLEDADLKAALDKTPAKYRGSGTVACFKPPRPTKELVTGIPVINCEGGKAKPVIPEGKTKPTCFNIADCTIEYPPSK